MTLDYFHQTITAVKNNIYFVLKNTTVTARGGEKRKLFIGVETNLQLHISISFTQRNSNGFKKLLTSVGIIYNYA